MAYICLGTSGNLSTSTDWHREEFHPSGTGGTAADFTSARTQAVTFSNAVNQSFIFFRVLESAKAAFPIVYTVKLQENTGTWVTRTTDTYTVVDPNVTAYPNMIMHICMPLTSYPVTTAANTWQYVISATTNGGTANNNWITLQNGGSGYDVWVFGDYLAGAPASTDCPVLANDVALTIDQSVTWGGTMSYGAILNNNSSLLWAAAPAASYTLTLNKAIWTPKINSTIAFGTSGSPIPYAQQAQIVITTDGFVKGYSDFGNLGGSPNTTIKMYGEKRTDLYCKSDGVRTASTSTSIGLSKDMTATWAAGDVILLCGFAVTGLNNAGTTTKTISSINATSVTFTTTIGTTWMGHGVAVNLTKCRMLGIYLNGPAVCTFRQNNQFDHWEFSGVWVKNVYVNFESVNRIGKDYINTLFSEGTTNATNGIYESYDKNFSSSGSGVNFDTLIFYCPTYTGTSLYAVTNNSTITNIIESNRGDFYNKSVRIDGNNNTISNVWSMDNVYANSSGFYLYGASNTLTNVYANGGYYALELYGAFNNIFTNCYFSGGYYQSLCFTASSTNNTFINTKFGEINGDNGPITSDFTSYNPFLLIQCTFRNCTWAKQVSTMSGSWLTGSYLANDTYQQTANQSKTYYPYGIISSTGTGLSDTVSHTSGGLALRLQPSNSTNLLQWSFPVSTGNIKTYQMTVAAWVKINSAVFYAGVHTKPTLSVSYDNGTTALAVAAPVSTVTVSIASPAVVTATAHGLTNGTPISFATTGALPTGLTVGTVYYVINAAANTFNISATAGGAAINTSGSQSGTHSIWQQISVPFTPTTTYGQITISVAAATDATTTDAYIYVDDVSLSYPIGYAVNLGSLDLWANGLPLTPSNDTTGVLSTYWADDPYVVNSQATAAAFTGIALNYTAKTVTITANHTITEIYEYCKQSSIASGVINAVSTRDGVTYALAGGWSMAINGCKVTSATQKFSGTVTLGTNGLLQQVTGVKWYDGTHTYYASAINHTVKKSTDSSNVQNVAVAYYDATGTNLTYNTSLSNTALTTDANGNVSGYALYQLDATTYSGINRKERLYGYQSASIPIAVGGTAIISTDQIIPDSYAVSGSPGGITGINVNYGTKLVTVTSANTAQNLYDYLRYSDCLAANANYPDTLSTADGSNFTFASGWNLTINGATLSGSGKVLNLATGTLTLTNGGASSANIVYSAGTQTNITLTGLVANSRVQIYNVTTATELYNAVVGATSLAFPILYTAPDTIRFRVMYVSGTSAKQWWTYSNTISNIGMAVAVSQIDDPVYNNNGIDGSTLTEFSISGTTIETYINQPTGTDTIPASYNWYMYICSTQTGIRNQSATNFVATDTAHYTFYNGMKYKNITSPSVPLLFTGAVVKDSVGSTISCIDTAGGNIYIVPSNVETYNTNTGSGLTTAEHLQLFSLSTSNLDASVSSRASQTSVSAIPTNPLLSSDSRLNNLDAAVSTRLPTASYTAPPTATAIRTEIDSNSTKLDVAVSTRNSVAPDNTSISAIKAKTDNLPSDPASNTQVNTRLASSSYTTPPTVVQVRTEMDSNSTKLANLDATVSSRSTYAGGAVASVAAPVTVATVNDKTGYALTSGEHTAIAGDAQSAMTAQGYTATRAGYLDTLNGIVTSIWAAATRTLTAISDSSGITTLLSRITGAVPLASDYTGARAAKLDNLDATVSSRNSVAPDNASIAAVKAKTDNLPSDPASNTQVATRLAAADYTAPPSAATIRGELDTNSTKLANLDATVSSRFAAVDYVPLGGADITAIRAKTDLLPDDPASNSHVDAKFSELSVPTVQQVDTQLTSTHGAGSWGAQNGTGGIAKQFTVMNGQLPLEGVLMWMSTDLANQNKVCYAETDTFGSVTFFLDPGTYYLWKRKSGFYFTNPEVISI